MSAQGVGAWSWGRRRRRRQDRERRERRETKESRGLELEGQTNEEKVKERVDEMREGAMRGKSG